MCREQRTDTSAPAARQATNTKSRGFQAPKAKAKSKACDPVAIACNWRRKTLRDFNKMNAILPAARSAAGAAILEA